LFVGVFGSIQAIPKAKKPYFLMIAILPNMTKIVQKGDNTHYFIKKTG